MSLRFGAYFRSQYGSRWTSLLEELRGPSCHIALLNHFAVESGDMPSIIIKKNHGDATGNEQLMVPLTDWPPTESHVEQPLRLMMFQSNRDRPERLLQHWDRLKEGYPPPEKSSKTGLFEWYWMDLASLLPQLMLDVKPGQKVLDACAAPGGKSLAIALQLFSPENRHPTGHLTCNDKSKNRRIRMASVLKSYLRPNLFGLGKIRFCGQSAETFWPVSEAYDRILIDAPCSSERHIIHQCKGDIDAIGREDWSVAKCSRLSKSQIRMIHSAFHALKPGGRIVYSTCSLDYKQNDHVIEKVCKKLGDRIHVISHDQQFENLAREIPLPLGRQGHPPSQRVGQLEKLRKGWIALPDECGWGPLYVSVIEKAPLHSDNIKECID
eukprot:jgi/Picsp_1/3213/NSC_06053-R1_methyltransferase nsun4